MTPYFKTDKDHHFMCRSTDIVEVHPEGITIHPHDHYIEYAVEVTRLEFLRAFDKIMNEKQLYALIELFKVFNVESEKKINELPKIAGVPVKKEIIYDGVIYDITPESQRMPQFNFVEFGVRTNMKAHVLVFAIRLRLKGLRNLSVNYADDGVIVRFKEAKYDRGKVKDIVREIISKNTD